MRNNSRTSFILPIPTNLGHNQIYILFNTTPFKTFEILQNLLLRLVLLTSKGHQRSNTTQPYSPSCQYSISPPISLLCNQRLIFPRHRSFRSRGRFAVRRERLSGSSGQTYRNLSELVNDSISLPSTSVFHVVASTSVLHVCSDLTTWRFVGIYTRPSALK